MRTLTNFRAGADAASVDSAPATPFWLWWNLLSADAPVIAIAWAALFARSRDLALPAANLLALALVVWLIYLADRILDAQRASETEAHLLKARHHFSARNRRALLCVIAVGTAAAAWLVREDLSALEIRAGLVLGAIIGLYMLCVHLPGDALRRFFPKEIAVGMIFAAGTMLPVWTSVAAFSGAPAAIAITRWALFALLCSLNCVAIACWERTRAHEPCEVSSFVAWCDSRLSLLAGGLVLLCCVAAAAWRTPAAVIPATTVGVAALLTWLLNSQRARISALALRVLADRALLLPALVALIRF